MQHMHMSIHRLLAFFAGCTLLLTTACTDLQQPSLPAEPSPGVPLSVPNSVNPMDSAGIYHNLILHDALLRSEGVDAETLPAFMREMMPVVLAEYFGSSTELDKALTAAVALADRMTDPIEWLESYANKALSERELAYIHRMGTLAREATDLEQLENKLRNLENELCAESWTGTSGLVAMGAVSVGRNSCRYWDTVIGSGSAGLSKGCEPWKLKLILAADVAGFIDGAGESFQVDVNVPKKQLQGGITGAVIASGLMAAGLYALEIYNFFIGIFS